MSKKKKQTTETKIPTWLEEGSKQAVARGQEIADREYIPYEGERIAGLDPSEQRAYEMAQEGVGAYQPDLDRARELTERGAMSFLDADIDAYMNPYVKGALDPAAREIREETARQVGQRGQEAGMMGAFGGARQAIAESETRRGGTEALSDLYQKGYERAFESGAAKFSEDRNVAARGAEQFRALSAQTQQQMTQDIQNLMSTGGLKRSLEQAGLDFDYGQFLEARDWDITNLQPLLAALGTVPYGTKTTATSKTSGLGNAIGVAAGAAGAVMMAMNPAASVASGAVGSMMGGGGGEDQGAMLPGAGVGGGQAQATTAAGGSAVQGTQGRGFTPTFYGSSYQPISIGKV
jgi:hypothetical protein